jgi:hypothetical protein
VERSTLTVRQKSAAGVLVAKAMKAQTVGSDQVGRNNKEPKRRIAPKVLLRCKHKIRELTQRTRGISLEQMMKELTAYLRGWMSYFGFCQT